MPPAASAIDGAPRSALPGTLLRWKRDTSAPVEEVDSPDTGWLAILSSIACSALGSPSGTVTSPEAIASSSWVLLSAIERSDSDSSPTFCDTAISSAILGVASTVKVEKVLRSEERRVGQECVRPCRYRWSQFP